MRSVLQQTKSWLIKVLWLVVVYDVAIYVYVISELSLKNEIALPF